MANMSARNNAKVTIGGKYISDKMWKYPNIKFIQDILDNNGKIATIAFLNAKYDVEILYYYTMV
jgi:phage-related tail protein